MTEPDRDAYHVSLGDLPACQALTMRDYFAGQALVGLLAHASGEDPHKAPGLAYKLADDMMAERNSE